MQLVLRALTLNMVRTGQARKEEPLPDIVTPKEPSLAGQSLGLPSRSSEEKNAPPDPASLLTPPYSPTVTQPHVAPEQATKAKTKRTKSSASNKRKAAAKEAAIERAHKLDKRKSEAGTKKELKKKAKQLWQ